MPPPAKPGAVSDRKKPAESEFQTGKKNTTRVWQLVHCDLCKRMDVALEESIESLSPLEFTRLRPGVYAGDTTYATQLAVEIFSNAVGEFRLGHGNKIEV